MNYDYSKRDYLLPEGCKDLIDIEKIKLEKAVQEWRKRQEQRRPVPVPLPPLIGEVFIPGHTTVLQLASLLNQKPFQLIADLMELGVFALIDDELDFDTIAKAARRHGYTAKGR